MRALAVGAMLMLLAGSCGRNDPGHEGILATNPDINDIDISLVAPLTTYSVTAFDPAKGQINVVWKMEGEACGTPKVPWTQEGPAVRWSHSNLPPDNCSHERTNHAVTITVIVTTQSGANRGAQTVCKVLGSESRHYIYAELHGDPKALLGPPVPLCEG
jgi:hypothetical protein